MIDYQKHQGQHRVPEGDQQPYLGVIPTFEWPSSVTAEYPGGFLVEAETWHAVDNDPVARYFGHEPMHARGASLAKV